MFKEMVQNADDAGATEVSFCLDYRHHASTRLAYEKLGPFQGWWKTLKALMKCQDKESNMCFIWLNSLQARLFWCIIMPRSLMPICSRFRLMGLSFALFRWKWYNVCFENWLLCTIRTCSALETRSRRMTQWDGRLGALALVLIPVRLDI